MKIFSFFSFLWWKKFFFLVKIFFSFFSWKFFSLPFFLLKIFSSFFLVNFFLNWVFVVFSCRFETQNVSTGERRSAEEANGSRAVEGRRGRLRGRGGPGIWRWLLIEIFPWPSFECYFFFSVLQKHRWRSSLLFFLPFSAVVVLAGTYA